MLERQWYAVCPEGQVGGKPLGLRRFARPLVVWRDSGGAVRCALDVCPHRGAALSRGRVVDGCLTCPYHGLRFGSDGRCVHVPAHPRDPIDPALRLRCLPTRVARGLVWVFNGAEADAGPLPWDDAFERELVGAGGTFVEMSDTLPVSYLRVMENLTDFHHLAHVHRRTAPSPAEVTAFRAERDGVHIRVEAELGAPDERRHLKVRAHVVAPCLAQLEFEGIARFAVVATPIDEDEVWLFSRYTQTAARIPGFERLLTRAFGLFDYRLLQRLEDLPVWQSQRLADPADIGRYTLLPSDEGVRLYFEVHDALTGAG